MKKTLIALAALSGLAMADDGLMWTVDIQGHDGVKENIVTNAPSSGFTFAGNTWCSSDVNKVKYTADGVQILDPDCKYAFEGNLGLKLADEFTAVMVCDLDITNTKTNTPTFLTIGEGAAWCLKVGFDTQNSNAITLSANGYTLSDTIIVDGAVAKSGPQTIILTMANASESDNSGLVSVYIDNMLVASTIVSSRDRHDDTQLNRFVLGNLDQEHAGVAGTYSHIELYRGVVPEPATATLSLLALAGLAARRKRH